MAKRSRTRPGQRPPSARHAGRPKGPPSRPAASLSSAEEARAAELEAQIVAQEREAEAGLARQRDRRRAAGNALGGYGSARTREGSLLAARAAEEYQYVARDVRRIVRVGGSLVGILAVLFVLIDIVKVIKL
jgi:hypothetical protein